MPKRAAVNVDMLLELTLFTPTYRAVHSNLPDSNLPGSNLPSSVGWSGNSNMFLSTGLVMPNAPPPPHVDDR